MSRVTISLASADFSVRAPREVLDSLHLFYPHSIREGCPEQSAANFVILTENDKWALFRDDRALGTFSDPMYALLALEFEIESVVAGSGKEFLALHAGGVATASGAWLVAGHPDTGKTSSTFQLLELGQAFLCEEIALYERATRRVLPHLQTLSMEQGFLDDYQSTLDVTCGRLVPIDSHITRFIPERVADSPATLHTVLLPRYRPGTTPTISEQSADSVLTEFLGYCFPPRNGEEDLIDAAIELLDTARLIRITYGSASDARDLLAELLSGSGIEP